ncbi:hypothetical protein CWE15_10450 [Aliidiomarina taiwanensis]|uniref:HDOD domain-containing protein n=1 Tax=Aliidiomarina taiwanensis TaxID=946228 RepID=A0A432WYP4_9GAMM|nr:HDOD domain-containing protein [Aliidiomarina taiwanensis]RUO38914.1 hypothetical protein CWE15_10450 [Aliidiomarina taiwanensis]
MDYQQFKALCESPDSSELARLDKLFNSLLISFSFARREERGEVPEEESAVLSRELLDIEQRRQDERDRRRASQTYLREAMSDELHERIYTALIDLLNEPERIHTRALNLSPESIELLDVLFARASSMKTIEETIKSLPWLCEDLIKMVNGPAFVNASDQRRVKVATITNALRFIGMDDLRLLVPVFCLRRWIPQSMEPFNLCRGKIRKSALSTGVAAQVIAEESGVVEPSKAFVVGLMHDLGKASLVRLYSLLFEDIQHAFLTELRYGNNSKRYNALLELRPSAHFLRDLNLHLSGRFASALFSEFELKYIPFHAVYTELNKAKSLQDFTGMGLTLYQAQRYSLFRTLYSEKLASSQDGKRLCAEAELSQRTLEALRSVNLKRLKLSRGAVR